MEQQQLDIFTVAFPDHQDRQLRYTWIVGPVGGYTVAEIIGRTDWDLLPQDEARRTTDIKQRVLDTGEAHHGEEHLTLAGSRRWRPMLLDHLGLAAAIEWQADEFLKASGISVELSLPTDEIALDRDTSTALFRLLQESLTNVVRHAKASTVSIRLWNDDQSTVLQVQDNGIGIREHSPAGATTFGLLSIKERALMLGGSLDVTTSPGAGTTITARVPRAAQAVQQIHSTRAGDE